MKTFGEAPSPHTTPAALGPLQRSAPPQTTVLAASPRLSQLRAMAEHLDQSPRQTAQRQAIQHTTEEDPALQAASAVQRAPEDEEEPVQGAFLGVQRVGEDEEEPLQGKLQVAQRAGVPINDDPGLEQEADQMGALAMRFQAAPAPAQRQAAEARPNRTGLPDQLKAGVENLSGVSLDAVRVHYDSGQPAQLNALAYAQGTDIHVAPGQEQTLPHEAWHVVQQQQGRVEAKATLGTT